MAKKQNPTPEYDSKREQNVLIDEIFPSVKKVAEQVTIMNEEILSLKYFSSLEIFF